ncbi:MAG: glycosyltransferase, partial [Candidatus Humimicrobiaceae bacterium]
MLNLAIFLDTFNETNGVAVTYKYYFKWNEKYKKTKTIIVSISDKDNTIVKKFTKIFLIKPYLKFKFPLYTDQILGFPPIKKIKKLLVENNINMILITDPGPVGIVGLYLAKKLNIPVFCFYHTRFEKFARIYGMRYGGKPLSITFSKLSNFLHGIVYKNCKGIFIQSTAVKSDLISFANSPVINLPIGIDRTIFKPLKNIENEKNVIAYVGRLAIEKNIGIILKILPFLKLMGIELLLIGDGPYRKKIEKKFGVKATGFVNQNLIPQLLKSCSALVFPSLIDTVGNVVFEAISMGLPVIIAKDTPIAKIIKEYGCGVEFDSQKPLDLLKSIIFLLNNRDKFVNKITGKNK